MKPSSSTFFSALLASVLVSGLTAMLVVSGTESPRPAMASPSASDLASSEGDPQEGNPALHARIEDLEMRLALLQSKIDLSARQAVASIESPQLDSEGVLTEDVAASMAEGSSPARDFVLNVLEDDRQRRQDEADQRRIDRQLQRLQRSTESLGDELGLSAVEEESLLAVFIEEQDMRRAAMEDLRELGGFGSDSRELIREQMASIEAWKNDALIASLGADTAQAVMDSQEQQQAQRRGRGGWDGGNSRGGRGGF